MTSFEENERLSAFPLQRYAASPEEHVYETHVMDGLPVIFHRDEVRCGCFCPTNWHDNVEILYFIEGKGNVVCENSSTEAEAGDIIVIDSNLIHRVETGSLARYFCLIVDNAFCHENGLFPETAVFLRKTRAEELIGQYNKIAEALLIKDDCQKAAVGAEVLRFMVLLLRQCRVAEERMLRRETSSGIRTALAYIRSHYSDVLDLDLLAAEAGISKFHFVREFKRITGHTVVTYINMVRMEVAARMLERENASVSEVAAACGFSGHSYFSKVFYKMWGMLPSEWAAQAQERKVRE